VEDSHIGLGAALAAGITCIVTKSSYTAKEDFTGADMIVDELGNDPTTGVTLETLETLLENKAAKAVVGSDDPFDAPADPGATNVIEALTEEAQEMIGSIPMDSIESELEEPPSNDVDAMSLPEIASLEEDAQVFLESFPMELLQSELDDPRSHMSEEQDETNVEFMDGVDMMPLKEEQSDEPTVDVVPPASSRYQVDEPAPVVSISEPTDAPIQRAERKETMAWIDQEGTTASGPIGAKGHGQWKTYVFWSQAKIYSQTFGGY
jgi:hypothetical protein